ncbi:hypothetical protein DLREEDagr8_06540 [Dongia sp. agr-C8]
MRAAGAVPSARADPETDRTAVNANASTFSIDNRLMAFLDEKIERIGPEPAVFASWQGHIPHTDEQARRAIAHVCDERHVPGMV